MVVRARLGELAGGWRHAYVRAACLTLGKARAAPSATRRCIAKDELHGQALQNTWQCCDTDSGLVNDLIPCAV